MSLLNKETVAVKRYATTYTKGRPVKTLSSSFTARGNIQPLSGKEVLQLPEGDRTSENLWMYTATEIAVNDEITRLGKVYEARESQNWSTQGMLQHYKVRLVKKDGQ